MELPHLGKNCSFQSCNKLDFLPMKCRACREVFCSDHFEYAKHECKEPSTCDVQVPVCPLCGIPVPGNKQEPPDVAVGAHIDNQCTSNSAKELRNKELKNPCSYKGCKGTEMVPLVCSECSLNYCLLHKHATDHACDGKLAAKRRQAADAAMARIQAAEHEVEQSRGLNTLPVEVEDNVSEDVALARAAALLMQLRPRKRLFMCPVPQSFLESNRDPKRNTGTSGSRA